MSSATNLESLAASDRATRPVAPDDLFRLRFIQSGDLSPDGRTAVYSVSQTGDEADEEHLTLWLQPVDGGEPRQLTAGRYNDTCPAWSPDGKTIAFLSDRTGKQQVHLIAPDGGEARAITSLANGVAGEPAWSPDGARIAFAAPPQGEPRDRSKPYRVTRPIYRADGIGYVEDALLDIYVLELGSAEPKRLTEDGWMNAGPQWSPDGGCILYLATLPPDRLDMTVQLRVVDLEGRVRELTGPDRFVGTAGFAPDGRIAYTTVGFAHKSNLYVIDPRGGEPECRSTKHVVGVGGGLQPDMPYFPASNRLLVSAAGDAYVPVQVGGIIEVERIPLSGPESVQAVVTGERACQPLSLRGDHLLFAASGLNQPTELFLAGLDGSDERQLTAVNEAVLGELALPAVQHLRFEAVDGARLEGWLLKPPGGKPPYPTVLYIHGGPHGGFGHIFSFDFQMLAGAGYAVLIVNQRGSTGYGEAFSSGILKDWGNLDYQDLMSGVDAAVERGLADPDRLGVCGISGGGNLSCWIIGHTDRFKAAVPEASLTSWRSAYGVSDVGVWFSRYELGGHPHEVPELYDRCSPITDAHRCTTPTLLVVCEEDWRATAEQSEQFYTILKANGCVVEMLRIPGSPHGGTITGSPAWRRAQNDALLEWMNRYVRGD